MASESIVRFRQRLAAKAQRCYWNQDIEGIMKVLDTIERKMLSTDDLAAKGQLDNSTAHIILQAAEAHLDILDFESCFCLCHDARMVVENSAERYRAAGLEPHPNSMVWVALLDQLADAKWKMPDPAHINRVMKSEEMYQRYGELIPAVIDRMAEFDYSQLRTDGVIHSMLWAGIMLYKQAMRFDPGACSGLESVMESLLPGVLSDDSRPYFWDVQIAEHVLTQTPDRSRLKYLFAQRRKGLDSKLNEDQDHIAYDRAAAKELEYLLGCRFAK